MTFTLGSGSAAQTCTGTTTSTGSASCTIAVAGQPQGPIPVTDTFGGNAYYQQASASSTVNLPEGTTLTVSPGSGTYNGSTTLTGTLVNTYTNQPVAERAGDVDVERLADLHRDDQRQRRRLVHGHGHRTTGDLFAHRHLRW